MIFEDFRVPAPSLRSRPRIPEYAISLEGDDLGNHVVEKFPVMAYEEQSAGIVLQHYLKQFQCFDIQIIGGLIQNQHVGGTGKQARQQQRGCARRRKAILPANALARAQTENLPDNL